MPEQQWQVSTTGVYMPGKYHYLEDTPTPPEKCTVGSSGTPRRCAADRPGVVEATRSWYTTSVKYLSLKKKDPQARQEDQLPYLTQKAKS